MNSRIPGKVAGRFLMSNSISTPPIIPLNIGFFKLIPQPGKEPFRSEETFLPGSAATGIRSNHWSFYFSDTARAELI